MYVAVPVRKVNFLFNFRYKSPHQKSIQLTKPITNVRKNYFVICPLQYLSSHLINLVLDFWVTNIYNQQVYLQVKPGFL